MKKTHIKHLMVILPLIFGMLLAPLMSLNALAANEYDYSVDLSNLSYTTEAGPPALMTKYSADAYDTFLEQYNGGNLQPFYATAFLFDGAGMVKSPDLDDAIAEGANYAPEDLSLTVVNINTAGNLLLTGDLTGMIAINTNGLAGDINLYLRNVNIDTDNKKAPAIFVYNKDITYSEHKVTIRTVSGSNNVIKGGRLKKVSLMDKTSLSGDYATYDGYYGLYNADEIEKILFAKVEASEEDIKDGDPLYFYKGAGAISSDIDLYFEGEGYLEVISTKKEGIESKGNLTFSGGTGDYYVSALDDALNTTTRSSVAGAHNDLKINVNSLAAVVDPSASEGDAIDSNGKLFIDGGIIYALAHPTSADDGLDSESGTRINGGTVVATGNMSDPIADSSDQAFIKFKFDTPISANTPVVIRDADGNNVFGFITNRDYKVLTFSSHALSAGSRYSIYTGGVLNGSEASNSPDGTSLYVTISSYNGGTRLATVIANTNPENDQPGGDDNPPTPPSGDDDPPTPPSDDDNPPTPTPPSGDDDGGDDGGNSPTPPADDDSTPNTPSGDADNEADDDSGDTIYIEDPDDVAVPSTSASVTTYPSTGRNSRVSDASRSVPSFAWAISGCSALTLVLYVLFERKKNAVRFRK